MALLRRASGVARGRLGTGDDARRELELAAAAAEERAEDYELALALDALDCFGWLTAELQAERDAIADRLGIIEMPMIAGSERDRESVLALEVAAAAPALSRADGSVALA